MNIIPNSVQLLNMSDDDYFGNGLPGHLSNSRMSLINPSEGGSVARFKNGFDQKTESLTLGTAVHQMVLEGEYYRLAEVDVPSDAVRKIINTVHKLTTREDNPLLFNDAVQLAVQLHNYYKGKPSAKILDTMVAKSKPYYEFLCNNHDDPSLIYLTPDLKIKCINAKKAVDENVQAQALLNPNKSMEYGTDEVESFNEHVLTCKILFRGKVYNLKLKMDNFTINHTRRIVTLNDLKTTSFPVDNFFGSEGLELVNYEMVTRLFKGSFQKYHYYRQMYMYLTILKAYVGQKYGEDHGYTFDCNMIVTETFGFKPKAAVFPVEESWLKLGNTEFDFLMGLIDDNTEDYSKEDADLVAIDLADEDYVTADDNNDDDLDALDLLDD